MRILYTCDSIIMPILQCAVEREFIKEKGYREKGGGGGGRWCMPPNLETP